MNAAELPREDKIKFVVNGKVFYYTEAELRDYFEDLYKENNRSLGDDSFSRLLAKLEKYDGDLYGYFSDSAEYHEVMHKLLDMRLLPETGVSFRAGV